MHAAVDAGARARNRCSPGDQLGGLQLVVMLLLAHGGGDFVARLHRPGICADALNTSGRVAFGRLLRIEDIFVFAELDLRLLPRHLEMIVALLIIFQNGMFGLLRCLAMFCGVMRNG